MPLANLLNRLMGMFGVKFARRSVVERLERELRDERRQRIELEKERQQSFLIPMDYDYACKPRPQSHVIRAIAEVIERDRVHIDDFIDSLRPIMHGPEIARIPTERRSNTEPCWNNPYLMPADAGIIYAVTAHFKPRTIIEVGSGNSSKFFRQAISDFQTPTTLISIDPAPRSEIRDVSERIINKSVLEVEPAFFDVLQPGDVLFIDGSHLVFNGTDIVYLMLEVLPRLRPGVFIHIHDIFLPWEYTDEFTRRGYAEQYLLAALLLGSEKWRVLAPVHFLGETGLHEKHGGSFWFTKTQI